MPLSFEIPVRPSSIAPPPLARLPYSTPSDSEGERRLRDALTRQYGCHAPAILTSRLSDEQAGHVTRKFCPTEAFGYFEAEASADAYLIGVDLGAGSRQTVTRGPARGDHVYGAWTVGVRSLDEDFAAHLRTAFDFVYFYLPRETFETIAQDQRQRFNGLARLAGRADPTLASMAQALLPALSNPHDASPLFLDYLTTAVALHVVQHYGEMSSTSPWRGGLARWQQKRAEEMLDPSSANEVRLGDLASECRLSRGYFVKAFKTTYGLTPHKWLSRARVERAKGLLLGSELAVVEIAMQCGFVDQSHLTRVFNQQVGSPPARWRREHRA